MKISDLNLLNLDKEEGALALEKFNDTKTNYPSDKTIHQLVEEIAAAHPDKIAVKDHMGVEITYNELMKESDTIAHFLLDKNITKEEPVALLLDASVNRIITLLGILKAGGAYVALNEDFPFKRNRFILEDTKARILISEKKYLKEMNRLQWETKSLKVLLCIDTDAIYEEEESVNELMNKDLWDYTGEKAKDDIAAGGWVNSYTGQDLSREIMDEYGDNILKKLRPILKPTDKVLEIGCSSGISMFRLAPLVAEYHGTDLSDEILKKTEQERKKRSLENIKLYTTPAHEIDSIGAQDFDVIIINSVIQCFEGLHYLRKVLSKAIDLLKDEGKIFLGDLMDMDTKDAFLKSLLDFKNKHSGQGYVTKLDWSNELFLSRSFIDDLSYDFPEMVKIQHSDKIYTIANELTDFRYDTLINIDKKANKKYSKELKQRQYFQLDRSFLLQFRDKGHLSRSVNSRNLAYIAYTSGTTGIPKGVLVEHRSVVRLVKNTNYIKISPDDHMLQTAPISFDAATFEIWSALLNAASLYMVEKNDLLDVNIFGEIITREKITVSWLTSSLFNQLVEQKPEIFQHLRYLLIGGDVLSPQHVNLLIGKYENLKVINGYGPTENTTFSTTFLIDKPYQKSIPIGKPIANSQCYILDDAMEQVPVGANGTLYVAGHGLARGYLNDPRATKIKFVDSPFKDGEKLYNTGDIAKWLPDGNIRFIGRNDNQVKIRGFRIELGEVEAKMKQITGLKNVLVTLREETSKEKYLCAYIATEANIDVEEIKKELQEHLPAYMVPAYIIKVKSFQLNTNGKIDLRVLPDPKDSRFLLEKDLVAPRNQLEEDLVNIWKEVLEIQTVSINENFFGIGGHSLKATQVVSRIRKTMVLDVSIRDIFANPTIASLSRYLQQKNKTKFQEIPKAETKAYYELSASQKRLWVLDQFEAEKLSYNMPGAFILDGLDRDIFQKTFEVLIERHESLRTIFVEIDGVPKQKIVDLKNFDFKLVHIDLTNEPDKEAKAKVLAEKEATTAFNLATGPLLRVKLIQLEEDKFMFLFTMHHIISDGWSLKVMVKEITTIYNAFYKGENHNLNALPLQYKDYSEWQSKQLSGEALQKHRSYWLEQLGPNVTTLELPMDYLRPAVKTSNGKTVLKVLDKQLQQKLYNFGEAKGASPFMTVLALTKILLYRYSGQDDIVVGTPIAGRQHEDLENQIGFFINTLALRTRFAGQDSFTSILEQVKNNTLDAYEHQIYPFDQLVEDLSLTRDMSRNPVFDVMVTFQNTGLETALDQPMEGVEVTPCESGVLPSKFDLSLTFQESSKGLVLQVEYNCDLFKESRINRMLTHFETLAKHALLHYDEEIDALDYMLDDEKAHLLEFGASDDSFQFAPAFLEQFQEYCEKYPNETAILDEGKTISFQELHIRVNKLAHQLKEVYKVVPNDFVAVVMSRSADTVVAALAIFKLGAVYVPMDPGFPDERLEYMLQDSKAKVVLTAVNAKPKSIWADRTVLEMGQLQKESNEMPATEVAIDYDEQRIAYVIYTSGSTGKPKGVMISHEAMSVFLRGMQDCLQLSEKDMFVAVNTPSFDISIVEIFLPLMTGGTILIASPETTREPYHFKELMNKYRPTFMDAAPSLWQTLIDVGWNGNQEMTAISGGEVLSIALGRELLQKTKVLWNAYGPTEVTVGCTMKLIEDEEDILSIGKPLKHADMFVLDKNNHLVPVGIDGELCVGGNTLSNGYLNLPELTKERFVANPYKPSSKMYKTGDVVRWLENGDIRFIGRKDKQVKVNGFRIELDEIEEALNKHEAVSKSIAIVIEREGEKELASYSVTSSETDPESLRTYLSRYLPHYMIPHHLIIVDSFPLMMNGKINTKALPLPGLKSKEYVAPGSETEKALVELWQHILKAEKIGIEDNFFSLGGHSLKATQLVSLIYKRLGVKLMLKDIFMGPTVKMLAQKVEETEATSYKEIPAVPSSDHYALSQGQKRLWVLHQLGDDQGAYNMPGAVEFTKSFHVDTFERALRTVVERHEILRTSFIKVNEVPVQKVHQVEELGKILIQLDWRGKDKVEEKVREMAEEMAQAIFDLSTAPLFRAKLVRLEDKYIFLFNVHHIIFDGWSMDVLLKEIQAFYSAFVQQKDNPLPPLTIQYRDFAAWQNKQLSGDRLKLEQQYWKEQFEGTIPVLDMPTDYARPKLKTYNGATVTQLLSQDVSNSLANFSSEHQISTFTVCCATMYAMLYRYTGQDDIVLGIPNTMRDRKELENQIGLYINTLALRVAIDEEDSFTDLLKRTKEKMTGAYDHQNYPFDRLVDDLDVVRDLSRSPLFDVMVVSQDFDLIDTVPDNEGDDKLQATPYGIASKTTKYDLIFNFKKTGNSWILHVEYNTDLFKKSRIEHFLNYYEALVLAAASQETTIGRLTYLGVEERKIIENKFNNTTTVFPDNKTIIDQFEEQVQLQPEQVAVQFGETSLSYQAVNTASNQLANYLIDQINVQPNDRIALLMEPSEQLTIALLGILKSGAAYVPVDTNYPQERIDFILSDTNAKCIITDNHKHSTTLAVTCPVIAKDAWKETESYPGTKPNYQVHAGDLAYVLYTSGSTGRPKGVLMKHKAVVNRLHWMWNEYKMQKDDVVLQKTPYSFDVSVWELFMPLAYGARLVYCPVGVVHDPTRLATFIQEYNITTLHFVPSMLQTFLQGINNLEDCSLLLANLRRTISSGEALSKTTVNQYYEKISAPLHNLYGPTEACVDVTHYTTQKGDSTIPIGAPIDNISIYILDEQKQQVPLGNWGEIAIAGVGLAEGYLNRPALTAEKFTSITLSNGQLQKIYLTGDIGRWQPDGNIAYRGRKDRQVKLRGQRIELAEIEHILMEIAGVDAVTVQLQYMKATPVLAAYWVGSDNLTPDDFRTYAATRLPSHMVPEHYLYLKKLPLNKNGKLDSKALPSVEEFESPLTEYVAPATPMEELLTNHIQNVLGIERLGVLDNFFIRGGDSIKAIQVASLMNQEGYKMTTRDLFQFPAIQDLAKIIRKSDRIPEQGEVSGHVPLTPIQKRFFTKVSVDRHHYNQSMMLRSQEVLNEEDVQKIFDHLLLHHDALRLVYTHLNDELILENKSVDLKTSIHSFDLRGHEEASAALLAHANELQAGIDLTLGPLIKIGLFHLDDGDRLLIIIHHLAIDGVSWRIILEDLEILHQQQQNGDPFVLPLKTDSYKLWAETLLDYANSPDQLGEIAYWKNILESNMQTLKKDQPNGSNRRENERTVDFALSPQKTEILLTSVNETYKTEINDILLTAFGLAANDIFKVNELLIDMEGHGREDILSDIDVGRTVGWFTSIYPVVLEVGYQDNLAYQIKTVKECLRKVPNKGIGFGILKYLTDEKHTNGVSFEYQPQLVFNYLGQVDGNVEQLSMDIAAEPSGFTISPEGNREHELVITAIVIKKQLRASVSYSDQQFKDETMKALINSFEKYLNEIIDHCLSQDKKEQVTPSDLGFKGLSLDQLENFFDS
jgi:amino acid adenylation domain-containing protein/non-ribosomal peptide synthase protein (TIGR01720 family)